MPEIKRKRRNLRKTAGRTLLVVWALLLVTGIVYAEIIRPNTAANDYSKRLNAEAGRTEKCFESLTKTTELDIFYAPDVKLDTKQKNIASIRQQINSCRQQVASFESVTKSLPTMRFAGYTPTFKEAKVTQRQALDVVGQSNDVMNQYDRMAAFLSSYYTTVDTFLKYTEQLSTLNTGIVTAANAKVLEDQATELETMAKDMRTMDAPNEFSDTKTLTADMFDKAATGFKDVRYGYVNYADAYTTRGFNQVDEALKSYDSTIVNSPFDKLTSSYIPKQVMQLPNKIDDLLAGASE